MELLRDSEWLVVAVVRLAEDVLWSLASADMAPSVAVCMPHSSPCLLCSLHFHRCLVPHANRQAGAAGRRGGGGGAGDAAGGAPPLPAGPPAARAHPRGVGWVNCVRLGIVLLQCSATPGDAAEIRDEPAGSTCPRRESRGVPVPKCLPNSSHALPPPSPPACRPGPAAQPAGRHCGTAGRPRRSGGADWPEGIGGEGGSWQGGALKAGLHATRLAFAPQPSWLLGTCPSRPTCATNCSARCCRCAAQTARAPLCRTAPTPTSKWVGRERGACTHGTID